MIEVASQVNNFLPNAQIAPVSPQDQLITITFGQLQAIIATAVAEALNTALERVSDMEADIITLRDEIVDLRALFETDTSHLAESIAQDRRRISSLEQSRTIPTLAPEVKGERTASRISKLKEYLKARGGGATFQEVERLLNIRPNQMTKLVSQLDKRSFEVFARSGDQRQRVIRLKVRIIQ